MSTRNLRKERVGIVTSNAMDKSIVVADFLICSLTLPVNKSS